MIMTTVISVAPIYLIAPLRLDNDHDHLPGSCAVID